MSEQPKRSPAKAWEAAQREALRAEGKRVAAMSDEALDASLAAKGVDPKAARERGAALAAKLMAQRQGAPAQAQPQAPAKVVSFEAAREKRRGRSVAWWTIAAAAAALVLGGGGATLVALNSREPTPQGPTVPSQAPPEPPPTAVAQQDPQELRKMAKLDCNAGDWGDCLHKLDQAYDLDPPGNLAWDVQRMRKKANRAQSENDVSLKPGPVQPRTIDAGDRAALAKALHAYPGVRVKLVCSTDPEAARFCGQLAEVLKKAGWTLERSALATEAGEVHGQRVEVATDADDDIQRAADALVDGLVGSGNRARGPDDMAPAPPALPLRITVGVR
jgi:hypothetical protein